MSWLILGAAWLALSAPGDRPPCKASNQGAFWPEAANTDPTLRRALMHDGTLEMCSAKLWTYAWKPVVVSVRQLEERRKRR